LIRVRVRTHEKRKKKKAHPARVAGVGRENITRVHEPKAHTSRRNTLGTKSPCYEAFPWSTNPRVEGAYAIKVSMRVSVVSSGL
jgi:hypothetical protein